MGVYIRLFIDWRASTMAIETVVGQLMGQKVVTRNHGAGEYQDVAGTERKPSIVVGLVDIIVKAPKGGRLVDGSESYFLTLHLESSDDHPDLRGFKAAIPRSEAIHIAVATRLIQMFGGRLDYNDADGEGWDLIVPFHRSIVGKAVMAERAEGGSDVDVPNAGFDKWWDIKPITLAEIVAADKHAVYHIDGSRS